MINDEDMKIIEDIPLPAKEAYATGEVYKREESDVVSLSIITSLNDTEERLKGLINSIIPDGHDSLRDPDTLYHNMSEESEELEGITKISIACEASMLIKALNGLRENILEYTWRNVSFETMSRFSNDAFNLARNVERLFLDQYRDDIKEQISRKRKKSDSELKRAKQANLNKEKRYYAIQKIITEKQCSKQQAFSLYYEQNKTLYEAEYRKKRKYLPKNWKLKCKKSKMAYIRECYYKFQRQP